MNNNTDLVKTAQILLREADADEAKVVASMAIQMALLRGENDPFLQDALENVLRSYPPC